MFLFTCYYFCLFWSCYAEPKTSNIYIYILYVELISQWLYKKIQTATVVFLVSFLSLFIYLYDCYLFILNVSCLHYWLIRLLFCYTIVVNIKTAFINFFSFFFFFFSDMKTFAYLNLTAEENDFKKCEYSYSSNHAVMLIET